MLMSSVCSVMEYKCSRVVEEWTLEDIWRWLGAIGMDKYVETLKTQFEEDGIVGADLKYLSIPDLKDYGIRNANDRRWILQQIRALKGR